MTGSKPRYRDTIRRLPPVVWTISLGILVNRIGNFLPVFIVLYLTSKHFSAVEAGLVLGAAGVGNVFGNGVGGYLADRIGRRWTIVLSMVLNAMFTASIPLVDTLPSLIALVGLAGVAAQTYRPAAAAILVDATTNAQERLAAFAVQRVAVNIGAAIGGALGGVIATISYAWLFLGNAAACLMFGAIAAALLRGAVTRPHQHQDPVSETAQPQPSYRQALADRRLRRFLAMTLIAYFVYMQASVGLPLHVAGAGLSPANFGLLMAINGLLVAVLELPITGLVAARRPGPVMAIGNILTGVGFALTGVSPTMILLAATVVLWTLGEMMYTSLADAHVGGLAPAGMGGRYQGLYGAAMMLAIGTGPLAGGALYAYHPWLLWVLCAVGGIAAGWLSLSPRRSPAEESQR